ncbi:Outer membrane protein H precursor [Minicystis rosea]|nr:Outer membrane protein H precursor [Minicystis rosea]
MHTPERLPAPRSSSWLRRAAAPALAAIIAGSSLMLATAPAAAQTAPSKVAVIDVRRAVAETEQGLRVQATLKKLFDARQVELDQKQRQLQADKEALEKEMQAGKSSKDVLQKKYEKLLQQDAELQRITVEAQREMQRKEQELTTPILQGIIEAVKRIAAQEGFEMVLEKSAVPYFRGDLELTDRAIQMYNSGAAGKGGPAPKAPEKPATPPAKAPAAPAPKK